MIFPEFKEVELAHMLQRGGLVRNRVIDVSKIRMYEKHVDMFHSLARFKDLSRWIKENDGSVSGLGYSDVKAYFDYIALDIDHEDPKPVLDFLEYLRLEYDIEENNMRLFFSGAKGYHIMIPSKMFGLKPSPRLHLLIKEIVKGLAEDVIDYDRKLYNKDRIFRINNSINSKTGLYKIQITTDDLKSGIGAIKGLAKQPRYLKNDIIAEENDELIDWASELESKMKTPAPDYRIEVDVDQPPFTKLCIHELLKGVSKDHKGGRKNVAFRLAVHFRNMGMPIDVVRGMLHGWNNLNSPPLSDDIVNGRVQSAFEHEYSHGCNDEVLALNCNENCYLFRHHIKID